MLIMIHTALCQAPPKMSYQAVIRDQAQNIIADREVSVRIRILEGSPEGPGVYSEEHAARTNANGLITLQIGTGTNATGAIDAVEWLEGPHLIRCEVDPQGGVNYSIVLTTELLSVPYAFFAAKGSVAGPQGPGGPVGPEGAEGTQGVKGPGIAEVTDDGIGTITFGFDDGTTYTTPVLTGPQGPQGSHDLSPYVKTVDLEAQVSGFEDDPVFANSPSSEITPTDISNWNSAYGWGNHQSQGYLKTETQGLSDVLEKSSNAEGQAIANVSAVRVGNETPDPTAIFQVSSTSQGFVFPRMTSSERDLIVSPAEGLMIYNTDKKALEYFNGSGWQDINLRR